MDDGRRRQFRWGVLLAWIFPLVLLISTVLKLIPAFLHPRTTGLTAVAGVSQTFEDFGIVTATVFQISAVVLLIRSWPGGQSPFRAMISLISIGCAVLILFICGAAVWSLVYRMLH